MHERETDRATERQRGSVIHPQILDRLGQDRLYSFLLHCNIGTWVLGGRVGIALCVCVCVCVCVCCKASSKAGSNIGTWAWVGIFFGGV